MGIGKEIEETSEIVKRVLVKGKYKTIMIVSSLIIFAFLYYLLVAKVADRDIWISVMMSGAGFVTFSIVSSVILAGLSGILLAMTWFKFNEVRRLEGKGMFGFIGAGISAFGVGCPTCGAFLFGLVGMPLALLYLPFKGLELQVLGIGVLLISVWLTGKSIKGVCKIK
jgi:hypothetical protein